jgi:hypothetical protein
MGIAQARRNSKRPLSQELRFIQSLKRKRVETAKKLVHKKDSLALRGPRYLNLEPLIAKLS